MITKLLKKAYRLEQKFDKVRWAYIRKHNQIGPLKIMAYRGFGNQQKAFIMGRLLEKRNILPARKQDSIWQNLKNMYKRFESNEVPGALVQAQFMGKLYESFTDEEGYFEFHLEVTEPLEEDKIWHPVSFLLLEKLGKNFGPVRAEEAVLIPSPKAEFGIISDVDDTVIKTEATSFVRMMRNTFLRNASTRLPFKGVAAFYRALHKGSSLDGVQNPLYYVSSSPWNLYDMLEEFWHLNKLPAGPFMLRDLGISEDKFIKSGHQQHKLEQIEKILSFTGKLPFILIGDSGQKDPEIYARVVQDFPGRIIAIYIRDVSLNELDTRIVELEKETLGANVEMILVKDTEMAAQHALEKGFIRQENIQDILQEKAKDQKPA